MTNLSAAMPEEPRDFMVDDTFTIFLKRKGKRLTILCSTNFRYITSSRGCKKKIRKNKRKVKGDLYEEIHKNHTCNLNYSRNHNWHNVFN